MLLNTLQNFIQMNLFEVRYYIACTIFMELLTGYYLISTMLIGYKEKRIGRYQISLYTFIIVAIVLATLIFDILI